MAVRHSRRRRRRHRLEVDLFPFLGIIVCVIGVIVLLISGLVAAGGIQETSAMARSGLKDATVLVSRWIEANAVEAAIHQQAADLNALIAANSAFLNNLQEAKKTTASLSKKLDDPDLESLLNNLNDMLALQQKMTEVQTDLDDLPQTMSNVGSSAQDLDRAISTVTSWLDDANKKSSLLKEAPELENLTKLAATVAQSLPDIQRDWAALQKQLTSPDFKDRLDLAKAIPKLRDQLAEIQKELEQLPIDINRAKQTAADAAAAVTIPLIPNSAKVRPVWIECHRAGLTVYRMDNGQVNQFDVGIDDVENSSTFSDVVQHAADDAKNNGPEVLNLLVRPDGVKSYDKAMSVIGKIGAPYSAIPITVDGKIRFRELPTPTTSP